MAHSATDVVDRCWGRFKSRARPAICLGESRGVATNGLSPPLRPKTPRLQSRWYRCMAICGGRSRRRSQRRFSRKYFANANSAHLSLQTGLPGSLNRLPHRSSFRKMDAYRFDLQTDRAPRGSMSLRRVLVRTRSHLGQHASNAELFTVFQRLDCGQAGDEFFEFGCGAPRQARKA